jgi:hypothetical protein
MIAQPSVATTRYELPVHRFLQGVDVAGYLFPGYLFTVVAF